MRKVVLATAAVTLLAPAPAARAVPPVVVTGTGRLSPGLAIPGAFYPISIRFEGTGEVPGGSTYTCRFSGSGHNAPMGGASGVLSGECGPIQYPVCAFELSPATWKIACTNGSVGSLAAAYDNPTYVTSFTANGVIS